MFGQLGYQPISWAPQVVGVAEAEDAGGRHVAGSSIDPNQFTLFQLAGSRAKTALADLHAVAPVLKGSDEKPDVQVKIELLSFQIGSALGLDPGMQATLRLDIGKDEASASDADPLFWSIAAGLDLAAQAIDKTGDPKQKAANLSAAFRRRPIEIPGGLADLRIELVAHEPPPWWRKIFKFADNAAVKTLVSAVGFPGIALDAVKLLDAALGRFEEARAKPIFQSRPMTVALSERAASEFTGGLDTVKAAVMNDGVFVMLRHADAEIVRQSKPIYLGGYGRLVPGDTWDGETVVLPQDDPYAQLSYAILKVKTREAAIETGF